MMVTAKGIGDMMSVSNHSPQNLSWTVYRDSRPAENGPKWYARVIYIPTGLAGYSNLECDTEADAKQRALADLAKKVEGLRD